MLAKEQKKRTWRCSCERSTTTKSPRATDFYCTTLLSRWDSAFAMALLLLHGEAGKSSLQNPHQAKLFESCSVPTFVFFRLLFFFADNRRVVLTLRQERAAVAMAAAVTTAAMSSGNIASHYEVLCLSKPKAVTHSASPLQGFNVDASQAPLSSSEGSAAASPLLTYSDVVDELDSERWSFAPYPRCTRSQLLQVHTFWVMVQRENLEEETTTPVHFSSHAQPEDITLYKERSEDGAASAVLSPSPKKVLPDSGSSLFSSSPRFACVVGVVWVRLASGTALPQRQRVPQGENTATTSSAGLRPLEGYLQVVLTHPDHRRRGLASSLLRACLASERVPANVFASDGEGGQPYRVERWHLHTLTAPTSISRAKRVARREGCRDAAASSGVDDDAEAIAATLAMYRRLGFAERRYLYGYYAGEKDAVELVKLCR